MIISRSEREVTVLAPAKVNLHLEVLGKRPDGYHEIETLLVTVSLHDRLVFRDRPNGIELECSDPRVGPVDDNLVVRGARLLLSASGLDRGVAIELEKRIPPAAGLAGGSSDAAATLSALNLLWGLHWPNEKLAQLGAQLGSDIPFFLDAPCAVATGRGEIVTPTPLGARLHLVLICPKEGLVTKHVYGHLRIPSDPVPIGPMREAVAAGALERIGALLHNRLEEVSVGLSPTVAELGVRAQQWDCLGRRMSGSGSAYFAMTRTADEAQRLADSIGGPRENVFVVHTSH